jgi:hypothetical protein
MLDILTWVRYWRSDVYTIMISVNNSPHFFRVVIIILATALVALFCLFLWDPSSWEARRVRNALSCYFHENGSYPGDLNALVTLSLLEDGSFESISYTPELGYGTYRLSASPWWGHTILPGPPISERSLDENARKLRKLVLKDYYLLNGGYPETLYEISRHIAWEYWDEIRRREYQYSVSEDLQSFTLEGVTFGPPSIWPSEIRLLSTEGKIQYLEIEINLFLNTHNRYPKSLSELLAPDLLADLTQEEDIAYEISENGKAAYINNKQVRRFRGGGWEHSQE